MSATLQPTVLRWARNRAGLDEQTLAARMDVPIGAVKTWEETGVIPAHLAELLAEKTHTPFGFLFVAQPPREKLPVADFRRGRGKGTGVPPSPELLDIVYQCQRRQQWYRDYQVFLGAKPNSFVGSLSINSPVETSARKIREAVGIGSYLTGDVQDFDGALRQTIENIEVAGVLVNRTGFAGNYTRRKLSTKEFRGFALCDDYAPLIFVNGADVPAAQMFTLAHEMAHIFLGESGVSNLDKTYSGADAVEVFCNQLAAEILVPLKQLEAEWRDTKDVKAEIKRLAHKYKVSRIVISRRAKDAGFLKEKYYDALYNSEVRSAKKAKGGNYYLSKPYEASRRFSVAVIRDARNGRTLYHDAMHLLGIRKNATFQKYASHFQLDL